MLVNYRNIGLIHLLYPNATIINMVRDPMDTLLSCYHTRFADDSSTYSLDVKTLVYEYMLYLKVLYPYHLSLLYLLSKILWLLLE